MKKLVCMMAGLVLAGGALAAPGQPIAARPGEGWEAWKGPLAAERGSRCSSQTLSRSYSVGEAGFAAVRDQINLELDGQAISQGGRLLRGEAFRLSDEVTGFTVTLEHRGCGEAAQSGFLGLPGGVSTKDCNYAGCIDPLPPVSAPEGSIMIIEACENFVRRTSVFRRTPDGRWVMVSYDEVQVSSCDLDRIL